MRRNFTDSVLLAIIRAQKQGHLKWLVISLLFVTAASLFSEKPLGTVLGKALVIGLVGGFVVLAFGLLFRLSDALERDKNKKREAKRP